MISHRNRTALSLLAITILLTAAGATTTSSASAATDGTKPLVRMASDLGFELTSQAKNLDGSVTAVYSNGVETVGVSGSPGISLSDAVASLGNALNLPAAPHSGAGSVVQVSLPGDKSVSPDDLAAQYQAAGRSVVQDAINLGMNPADAAAQFGHTGATMPLVSGGGGRMPGMGAMGFQTSPAPVYDSFCASLKSDADVVKSYACDERRKDQVIGSDWYVEDAFTDSAVSTDTCWACWMPDRLTKIYADLHFASGNSTTKWTPTSTLSEPSSCRDVTLSLSSPRTGVGYSETAHVCSDSFGLHSVSSTAFGTTWDGHEPKANWYEATEGVNIVHSPPGTAAGVSMTISHQWCEC